MTELDMCVFFWSVILIVQSPRTPIGSRSGNAVEAQSIMLSKPRGMCNARNMETTEAQAIRDELHARKLRNRYEQFERYHGRASRNNWEEAPAPTGKAQVAKPAALSGNYDVITGEWSVLPSMDDVANRERPKTAGERSMLGRRNDKYTRSCYDKRTNQWVEEEVPHGPKRVPHPGHVGDYDPVKQQWIKEPEDKRFLDRETTFSNGFGTTRAVGRKRIPLPPDIGRYDPITNKWILPPADKKFENREAFPAQGQRGREAMGKARVDAETEIRGIYDPIKNTWTEPPQDPRALDRMKSSINLTRTT